MPLNFEETLTLYLSAKDVGPRERKQLSGLLKYYAKKPHPFRACVRDNRKRFGPGTEAVCATLKDIIRGTTHWRGNKSKDKGASGIKNLSEDENQSLNKTVNKFDKSDDNTLNMADMEKAQDLLNGLTDSELENLIELARTAQLENEDQNDEDVVLDTPPAEANYGNADIENENCGSCSHYADGLCGHWVAHVDEGGTCNQVDVEQPEQSLAMSELYFAEAPAAVKSNKNGVWKKVLKTGKWAMSPGPFGAVQKPMTVVRGEGRSDFSKNIMSLDDIVSTFQSKAIENVTVPLEHVKDPEKNSGFVEAVEIETGEDGNDYLKALINFTEPEVESKVLNGSIRNTSVGVKFKYPDKENGKVYPIALDHVALTNKPFLKGIPAFSFSEQEGQEIPIFIYSEENGDENMEKDSKDKDVLLSELEAERQRVEAEKKEKLELSEENATLKRELRKSAVEKRVKELADGGLASYPGLLKKVEEIMLSDTGEKVIELSEDGENRSVTSTEIVEGLLEVIPLKDLLLSEQHENTGGEAPLKDASEEKNKEERLKETEKFLAGKQ